MKFTIAIAILASICMADNELCYHNGTPQWYSWGGTYRGTWFDVEDFNPGSEDFLVEWVEIWFYQSSMTPWDTDQFTVEIWNGDEGGPIEFLASEQGTAQPGGITLINFDPPVETGPDFWCILSTEFSASGCPWIFADGVANEHSFFSDDYLIWDSFDLGNYFMAVGNASESLSRSTWGSLKVIF